MKLVKGIAVFGAVSLAASAAWAQCSSSGSSSGSQAHAVTVSYNESGKTIVETAVAAGQFNTLVAAVKAAGLVEALSSDGPFTVFAPTDEAFSKLPKGTLDYLLKPENKAELQGILTYHVVADKLPAGQVVKRSGGQTLNGQWIDIKTSGDRVMIDQSRVLKTDIMCSNGIIHVIDAVILPTQSNLVEVASQTGKFNTLLKAATAAGLASTLAKDGPFTIFAPTDEAFAKLPAETLKSLLQPENKDKLAEILKYHVVSGRVYSTQALQAGQAGTLQGQKVQIKTHDGGARVNGAKLLATDIDASNGVVHVIDEVLMPK